MLAFTTQDQAVHKIILEYIIYSNTNKNVIYRCPVNAVSLETIRKVPNVYIFRSQARVWPQRLPYNLNHNSNEINGIVPKSSLFIR